jgi:hypothetical protein
MKQTAESRTSFGAVCATPKKQTVHLTRAYRPRISDAFVTTGEAGKRLMISMMVSYEAFGFAKRLKSRQMDGDVLYSAHTGLSGRKFRVAYENVRLVLVRCNTASWPWHRHLAYAQQNTQRLEQLASSAILSIDVHQGFAAPQKNILLLLRGRDSFRMRQAGHKPKLGR